MRDNGRTLPRAAALAARVAIGAIGLAGIVGCGGRGGDDDGGSTPVDYLKITSPGAEDVAGLVIRATAHSLALAEAGGVDIPIGVTGAAARAGSFAAGRILPRALARSLREQPSEALGPLTQPCFVAGTLTLSGTLASPGSLTAGDHIAAVLDNCEDVVGSVGDGRVDLLMRDVEGDPATDIYLLDAYVELAEFVLTERGDSVTADGAFVLTRDSMTYPLVRTRVIGDSLAIGFGGDVVTLTDFDTESVEPDRTLLPLIEATTTAGTLSSRLLAGKVDYDTTTPVAGPVGEDPVSGDFVVTGADGATIRVVVSGASVQLQLEQDGNGGVDEVRVATWADLAGKTAPGVTAVTAPIIVREALAAAGELEATVRDAGAQFGPNGAFYNALPLITAAGPFGPVAPSCQLSSGSASVAGNIAVIGAFSPADEFDGTFIACDQATPPGQYPSGSIVLTGSLATVVSDYADQAPGFTASIDGNAIGLNGGIHRDLQPA